MVEWWSTHSIALSGDEIDSIIFPVRVEHLEPHGNTTTADLCPNSPPTP